MNSAAEKNGTRSWEKQFKQALRLRDEEHFDEAIEILTAIDEGHPDTPAVLGTLGNVYWDKGELKRAATCFKRTTELSPKSELASLGLFHVLWELSRWDQAKEEMDRFLAVSHSKEYDSIAEELVRTAVKTGTPKEPQTQTYRRYFHRLLRQRPEEQNGVLMYFWMRDHSWNKKAYGVARRQLANVRQQLVKTTRKPS